MEGSRGGNFDRAGVLWTRVWTFLGLTCVSVGGPTPRASRPKAAYCLLVICVFAGLAYYQLRDPRVDRARFIMSFILVYTDCSSLVSSAIMIALTVANGRTGAGILLEIQNLLKKHSVTSTRSLLSYFPVSCLFPCCSIIVADIIFAVFSPASFSPIILTGNCFSIYSFIFFAKTRYYLSAVEDGFRGLTDRLHGLGDRDAHPSGDRKLFRLELPEDNPTEEVKRLRMMYHEFFGLSRRVGGFLSSRTILAVTHNFAIGVLFTYNAISEYLHPTIIHRGVPYWMGFSYWSFCCFINLFVTVQPYERVAREGKRVATAVQSLSTLPGFTAAFYDELRNFSSQLILEDVQFAPHNFITLNKPTLLSSLGAMSSALAIILQMNATE